MNSEASTEVPCEARPASEPQAQISEQLRLYDQPLALAEVVLPATRADVRRSRRPAAAWSSGPYGEAVQQVSRAYDIDPDLIHAVMRAESAGRPRAVSSKGARGLMQVMPATGRRFGAASPEALADPRVNLQVGAAHLKTLQGRFGNNLPVVLAAYNAGEGAVARHGAAIPPYRETRDYVVRVLAFYAEALAERAGPLAERAGPLAERAGPLAERAGPLAERAGPLAERAGQ